MLKELRVEKPRAELRFWCDRKFAPQARSIVSSFDERLRLDTIVAGKLRRYHHLTVWQQLTWPSLVFSNLRDGFLVGVGVIQSIAKLVAWRPDVIFTKGGYLCLPVGVAARLLRIPLVIHDSDAHPGLTNRILSRWAQTIATGAPLEHYPYDIQRSHYVGIPIDQRFQPVSAAEQREARRAYGVAQDKPLVAVTGGGLGATRINDAIVELLPKLLDDTSVVLVSGAGQFEELRDHVPANSESFQLHSFVNDMPVLLAAADVVIARAGATTILELAALRKPTILIPNAKLTGGHQLKNAAVYEAADAVKIVNEDEMERSTDVLLEAIRDVLAHPDKSLAMARRFHAFSKPDAAKDMAQLILKTARRKV